MASVPERPEPLVALNPTVERPTAAFEFATLNTSTPLFCPLRIFPPAVLLKMPEIPLELATSPKTPVVLPLLALALPTRPTPLVLALSPRTPAEPPLLAEALP